MAFSSEEVKTTVIDFAWPCLPASTGARVMQLRALAAPSESHYHRNLFLFGNYMAIALARCLLAADDDRPNLLFEHADALAGPWF
jgi:hypothetical protein